MADSEETVNFKVHVWYLNFTVGSSASTANTATMRSSPDAATPVTAVSGAPVKVDLSLTKAVQDGSLTGQRYLGAVLYSRKVAGVYKRLMQVKTVVSLV
jgi:hypothetical protein